MASKASRRTIATIVGPSRDKDTKWLVEGEGDNFFATFKEACNYVDSFFEEAEVAEADAEVA
jgi:hypothetical protein